jgi:hypothetical protein
MNPAFEDRVNTAVSHLRWVIMLFVLTHQAVEQHLVRRRRNGQRDDGRPQLVAQVFGVLAETANLSALGEEL